MHETGEEGVAREVLEETGLQVEEAVYQFSLLNPYLYSGFLVHTLSLIHISTCGNPVFSSASDFSAMAVSVVKDGRTHPD